MGTSLVDLSDTIAAISTPMNRIGGGIGIVRLSGPQGLDIARKVFRPIKRDAPLQNRKLVLGHIVHPQDGHIVDEVFLVYMKAPFSYTREDVVEFHCHGGHRVTQHVLEIILSCGARTARAGEFTLRAFVNGRVDLTRAEAVLDLIQAKSRASLRIAAQQLGGGLEGKIRDMLSELQNLETFVEANIDFPEEDIPVLDNRNVRTVLSQLSSRIDTLLSTFQRGMKLLNGYRITIAGLPNVGKSSLMNCLLQRNRSIVSPFPGTTRDYIEETIELNGIPIQLTDTAGIRNARNAIEEESISRTKEKIDHADLVLLVLDSSRRLDAHDRQTIVDSLNGKQMVIVLNKDDIKKIDHLPWVKHCFPHRQVCITSAITGKGINELGQSIIQILADGQMHVGEEMILTNARHAEALQHARAALQRLDILLQGPTIPLTLMATDLHDAITALKGILGIDIHEDALGKIFQRFCIGK